MRKLTPSSNGHVMRNDVADLDEIALQHEAAGGGEGAAAACSGWLGSMAKLCPSVASGDGSAQTRNS
jgi:hypothetical protein